MLDEGLKTESWTSEQINAHLQRIGADKLPSIVVSSRLNTTAPQIAMKIGRYQGIEEIGDGVGTRGTFPKSK
ncbi:hypothetical protein MKX50_06435 [Paenibacillus sp. FSL W8-0186]|uniref:hypothetical protein n=1 Tax=Paenibacillus sp. FSL W8-0186 TaxID=2921709 RepID=UPI0030CB6FA7